MILFAEKSEFNRHILFWWLIAPLLTLLILPAFMQPESFAIASEEVRYLTHWGSRVHPVTERADALFNSLFVDSGWVRGSLDLAQPRTRDLPAATGLFRWLHGWIAGFWMLLYRVIWRVYALLPIYLAAILGYALPAFVDGLTTRLKKRYDFGQHNPIFFYSSMHFVLLAVGLALFVPITPLTLTPWILGGYFLLTAAAVWIMASNLQTGG